MLKYTGGFICISLSDKKKKKVCCVVFTVVNETQNQPGAVSFLQFNAADSGATLPATTAAGFTSQIEAFPRNLRPENQFSSKTFKPLV